MFFVPVPMPAHVTQELEGLGGIFRSYEDMTYDDIASVRAIVSAVPVLVENKLVRIDSEVLETFPHLRLVANLGAGCDHIDLDRAAALGIKVTNTADVLTEDTADLAVGLFLTCVRQLNQAERHLRMGLWSEAQFPLTRSLRDYRIGIFGLGRIGLAISRRLEAFGLAISYHNRRPLADVPYRYEESLLSLARSVDCLIVAAPATSSTARAVNAEVLAALGTDGLLINIARGSLVDEAALISALERNIIAGAGLDVYHNEPNVPASLLAMKNVMLLPHIGSATQRTRDAMSQSLISQIKDWYAQQS